MKIDKNEVKSKNNINEHISAQNIIKPPLLPFFISSVIQFDKFLHPVVLYENYLICIFINNNENFCNERKNLRKIKGCTDKMTNVSPTMCSSVSNLVGSANSMLRHFTFTTRYNMKNNYHEYS